MIFNNFWAWREACERVNTSGNISTSMRNTGGAFIPMAGARSNSEYLAYSSVNYGLTNNMTYYVSGYSGEINDPTRFVWPSEIGVYDKTISVVTTSENGKLRHVFTCKGNNKAPTSITISSIYITKSIYFLNDYDETLMFGTHLSEPITVPPGSGFSITVEMIEE